MWDVKACTERCDDEVLEMEAALGARCQSSCSSAAAWARRARTLAHDKIARSRLSRCAASASS